MVKNRLNILLSNKKITGQKSEEILFSEYEKKYIKIIDSTTKKLMIDNLSNVNISKYKKMKRLRTINEVHNFISKLIKGYYYKKNQVEVSKIV